MSILPKLAQRFKEIAANVSVAKPKKPAEPLHVPATGKGNPPFVDTLPPTVKAANEAINAPVYAFPISAINVELLAVAAPHLTPTALQAWVGPLQEACARFEINTIRRIAAFIGNLAHESGFKVGARENMNYSAKRLAEVWPSRFRGPNALARSLDRKPELIANHVYANRMGNGGPQTGDGFKFRGNGPIQLTGRANHTAFAKAMNMTVDEATAWIGTVEGGVMSAAWFWEENDINRLADTPGVEDEVRRINGGTVGIEHRRALFNKLVAHLLKVEGKA